MKTAVNKKQALPFSYPFDWNGLENFRYPKDADGLPLVFMGKKVGLCYNPITISQYGLSRLQMYDRDGSEKALVAVRAVVNWLVENCREWRSGIQGWVYDYDLDFYGPSAPWISGMAQAQGISLLLRAYPLFLDERMLATSQAAFEAFLRPVSEGGVAAHFPDGSIAFEEFPTDPPSLVLNGHLFALLGVYDYAQFWHNKTARDLFAVALAGLKKNLESYDTGFWNLYDLHPTRRLASPTYLKVHVRLLDILREISGDDFFLKVAQKWHGYLRSPQCRVRWFFTKMLEKVRLFSKQVRSGT